IGTMYGGDGESTFALPNLQSRVPLHFGAGPDGVNYAQAEAAGTESVTLTAQQIPIHNHALLATGAQGSEINPRGNLTATPLTKRIYAPATAPAAMNSSGMTPIGGSQPHDNTQPFLCINYIISLFGIFPSPT
ncbi:MAG TPA: tail fiber protein, partial [Longimicrobium sp.]|nr:tail fiber protein [Longimicrobium sp.]